jgi:hypothetical protein
LLDECVCGPLTLFAQLLPIFDEFAWLPPNVDLSVLDCWSLGNIKLGGLSFDIFELIDIAVLILMEKYV